MTPYFERNGITLYCGDCLDILPLLEPGSVDCVVTDPPYGTGGWRRTSTGNGDDPSGKLIQEAWDDGEVEWMKQSIAFFICTSETPNHKSQGG